MHADCNPRRLAPLSCAYRAVGRASKLSGGVGGFIPVASVSPVYHDALLYQPPSQSESGHPFCRVPCAFGKSFLCSVFGQGAAAFHSVLACSFACHSVQLITRQIVDMARLSFNVDLVCFVCLDPSPPLLIFALPPCGCGDSVVAASGCRTQLSGSPLPIEKPQCLCPGLRKRAPLSQEFHLRAVDSGDHHVVCNHCHVLIVK